MDSIKGLYNHLAKSQTTIQIATVAVVLVWGLVLMALLAGCGLLLESQAQTSPQTLDGTTPAITLDQVAPVLAQFGQSTNRSHESRLSRFLRMTLGVPP